MVRWWFSPVVSVLFGATGFFAVTLGMDGYFTRLQSWQEGALTEQQGEATASLFTRAVEDGLIVWEPRRGTIELRPGQGDDAVLEAEVFDLAERGRVIRDEIARSQALASFISIRVRLQGCAQMCESAVPWEVLAGPEGQPLAERLAWAAAQVEGPERRGLPAPLPEHNAVLWRQSGPGYAPWRTWHARARATFVLRDPEVDQVDILGHVPLAPDGWEIAEVWCRVFTDAMVHALVPCTEGSDRAATRLRRSDPDALLRVDVVPTRLLPESLPQGNHTLTERLRLECDDGQRAGRCAPVWVPNDAERRYSLPPELPPDTDAYGVPLPPDPPPALGPWVSALPMGNDGFRGFGPSELAQDLGAVAVIGQSPSMFGTALAGLSPLSPEAPERLTLDPEFQEIAQNVLLDLTERRPEGAFAGQSYSFAPSGLRASITLIDLRPSREGAILAAVGRPNPPLGLSPWDIRAASHDGASGLPPGPPAWSGRRWHHIPGSVFKMVTALALIDAATDPTLSTDARRSIRVLIDGVDAISADANLGQNVLSGQAGLCIPTSFDTPLLGVDEAACPTGTYAEGIVQDSGAGGPLRNEPLSRYGLHEAIARSSNIWFSAALLRAELLRYEAAPILRSGDGLVAEPARIGDGFAATLARLSLDRVQPLDAGRGLVLLPRDGAEVEALLGDDEAVNLRSLASASFGQQVQAGPLMMAQIAGSIRLGRDVRPTLVGPTPQPEPLLREGAEALAMLNTLRDGMQDTVSGGLIGPGGNDGTAAGAFVGLRRVLDIARVGGKTGTANRDEEGLDNISTFAGWMDTTSGAPGFAIGCAITVDENVPQLCARAAAEIMARIEAAELAVQ